MRELWNGFQCEKFTFEGRDAILVFPEEGTANGRLALKTEYWGAFPNVEIQLLKKGFRLAFLKNETRFVTRKDCDIRAAFVRHLAKEHGLNEQCALIGMSLGGAQAVLFAGYHPELTACMYLDAPCLNYCMYTKPCFRDTWDNEFLKVYPGTKYWQMLKFPEHPINMADVLVENRIPVMLVYGIQDATVIYEENSLPLVQAYEGTDLLTLIAVDDRGHHPHSTIWEDEKVTDFIVKHCSL